jgi:hypothetical protein
MSSNIWHGSLSPWLDSFYSIACLALAGIIENHDKYSVTITGYKTAPL